MTKDAIISNANRMMEDDVLSEGVGGYVYEKACYRNAKEVSKVLDGFKVTSRMPTQSEANNAHKYDLVVKWKGKEYPIELKQSYKAQMSHHSFNYEVGTKNFSLIVNKAISDQITDDEYELFNLIVANLKENSEVIDSNFKLWKKNATPEEKKLIKMKLSSNTPYDLYYNEKTKKNISHEKYDEKPINSFLRSKGIHYIQIGGSGLFTTSNDPMGLGAPKLDLEITLEIRLFPSGKKIRNGIEVVTVSLSALAKISKKPEASPISFDEPRTIVDALSGD